MRVIVKGVVVRTLGLIQEEEHPMRISVVLTMAMTLVVAAAALPGPASAADVKAVLEACDRTKGCGYSVNDKNGDISGCTAKPKAGPGSCFYCPNDGKRQCFAVRKTQQGQFERVPGDVLKSMIQGEAPATVPPRKVAPSVVPGVQPPTPR